MHNPASHKPHQKVAHVFITFNSPETANKAVQGGLSIEGKKVMATHTHPKPMCCFCCQCLHKHLINNCPENEDTCGMCSKYDHHTSQCQETCTDNFYCVNCKTYQHASWDQTCPTFLKEKAQLQAHQPEHRCKYFSIQDNPSTWPKSSNPNTFSSTDDTPTSAHYPNSTPPPPPQQRQPSLMPPLHHHSGDTWTSIKWCCSKKTHNKTKESTKEKGHKQVCSHQLLHLTLATGTQTFLNDYIRKGEPSLRCNTPTPEPNNCTTSAPSAPVAPTPSNYSPSHPIHEDLNLTTHPQ